MDRLDFIFDRINKRSVCVTAIILAVMLAVIMPCISAFASGVVAIPLPDVFEIDAKKTLGIIDLVIAALGGAIGFLVKHLFGAKGKMPLTPEMQSYINMAVQYGLGQLQMKAKELALDMKNPTVKSKLVADTVNAILSYTPLLFQHFGLSQDNARIYVETKLTALLEKQEAAAAAATNG